MIPSPILTPPNLRFVGDQSLLFKIASEELTQLRTRVIAECTGVLRLSTTGTAGLVLSGELPRNTQPLYVRFSEEHINGSGVSIRSRLPEAIGPFTDTELNIANAHTFYAGCVKRISDILFVRGSYSQRLFTSMLTASIEADKIFLYKVRAEDVRTGQQAILRSPTLAMSCGGHNLTALTNHVRNVDPFLSEASWVDPKELV